MLSTNFILGLSARYNGRPSTPVSATISFGSNVKPRAAMATLQSAIRAGTLSIRQEDEILMLAIAQSDDFEHAQNHHWPVNLYLPFPNINHFIELGKYLEGIKFDEEPHKLAPLQSGREKKRREFVQQVERTWVTPELREELDEWGMDLVFETLKEDDEFYLLRVLVSCDGEPTHVFDLDGITGFMRVNVPETDDTGLMSVNQAWMNDRVVTPAIFRDQLSHSISSLLEVLTAA